MRSLATRFVATALGLVLVAGNAMGQGYGSPSLLPLPEEPDSAGYQSSYAPPQYRAANQGAQLVNADEPTPAEAVPTPLPEASDDYNAASPSDLMPSDARPATTEGCAGGNCYDDNSCCDDNWIAPWCSGGCGCNWFGSVGGLVLTRDNANPFWTSYQSTTNANQIMNTEDANANWNGGWLVSFGTWFGGGCGNGCGDACGNNCCGGPRCGIGVTYFSTSPMQGSSTVFAADPLNNDWVSSTIDMNDVGGPIQFPDGNEVDDYFDNSLSQTIARQDYIQSVEINFLSQYWQPNANCQVTWLAGVRWFRFDESLLYSAVAGASTPTGSNTAYMDFDCTNDLVGFQLGARCDWYLTQRFSLFCTPKFGLYGNYIQTQNRFFNGDGSYLYNLQQDTTGVSFLGQVDVGASWQFSKHWRGYVGYMAVAVTGVALSDNQIPHYLAAQDELSQINSNGSLIVHGGMAGLEFCF